MKTVHTLTATILGAFMLVGCSSQPTQEMPTDKVMVSQADDKNMACPQLETNLESIEHDVAEMLKIKQQRSNKTFAISAIADMTIALLSGSASANNHIDRSTLEDFTQPERERINSLAQRHNHLLLLSKEKKCAFVPKVEERIKKFTEQKSEPTSETTNYRQRKGGN